jgi:hypothetical protein
MIPSTASVRFRPDGAAEVDTALRLTPGSHINCFTYPGRPPILSIDDAHVSVTVTVPESGAVTGADLDTAHRLADAVARYITGLHERIPSEDIPDLGDAAA